VQARALRDMAAPGTAYDDPALGKDPQVGHMDDYIETTEDNGGVHLNSGIPNRAFQLAATGIGGSAWEGAGRIWYAALTSDRVGADTEFAGFAAATVALAGDRAEIVRSAWQEVGVAAAAAPRRVRVRRSGGFIGRTVESTLELTSQDPRSGEVGALLNRVDPSGVRHSPQQPDRFSYEFDVDGRVVSVREQDLTDDLRRIADLILGDGTR
jgi:hypothetical protein